MPEGFAPTIMLTDIDVAGPMGRGYVKLPCQHHKVSFASEQLHAGKVLTRTCRYCRRRFTVKFRHDVHESETWVLMTWVGGTKRSG